MRLSETISPIDAGGTTNSESRCKTMSISERALLDSIKQQRNIPIVGIDGTSEKMYISQQQYDIVPNSKNHQIANKECRGRKLGMINQVRSSHYEPTRH